MRTIFVVLICVLLGSSLVSAQDLKHRPKPDSHFQYYVEGCIDIKLWRQKGKLYYQYLTDLKADGDLRWELGELMLSKGRDCRVNIILDQSTNMGDLKYAPRLAVDAGFWDIHIYVSMDRWYVGDRNDFVSEVTLMSASNDTAEIVYGAVQRLARRHLSLNKRVRQAELSS